MGINKNGVINFLDISESKGHNLVTTNLDQTISFIPTTDNNSTVIGYNIMFNWDEDSDPNTVYRVIIDIKYSGFDTSNTSGTFDLYFQGAIYDTSLGKFTWDNYNSSTGRCNHAANILNSIARPKNVVLSSTSGVYLYNTTFTLPQEFRNGYSGFQLGIRSNYSNGTAKIEMSNCKISMDKYSLNSKQMSIFSDNVLLSNELNEL